MVTLYCDSLDLQISMSAATESRVGTVLASLRDTENSIAGVTSQPRVRPNLGTAPGTGDVKTTLRIPVADEKQQNLELRERQRQLLVMQVL